MSKYFNVRPGRVYGRLTVLRYLKTKRGQKFWACACACGTYKSIGEYGLKYDRTHSCGCLRSEHARRQIKIAQAKRLENKKARDAEKEAGKQLKEMSDRIHSELQAQRVQNPCPSFPPHLFGNVPSPLLIVKGDPRIPEGAFKIIIKANPSFIGDVIKYVRGKNV